MDQDTTCYGGRPRSRRHCVRKVLRHGRPTVSPRKGAQHPPLDPVPNCRVSSIYQQLLNSCTNGGRKAVSFRSYACCMTSEQKLCRFPRYCSRCQSWNCTSWVERKVGNWYVTCVHSSLFTFIYVLFSFDVCNCICFVLIYNNSF